MKTLRDWSFYAGLIVPAALVYLILFSGITIFVLLPLRVLVGGFLVVCLGLAAASWKFRRAFATGLLVSTPVTFLAAGAFLIWAFGQNIVK